MATLTKFKTLSDAKKTAKNEWSGEEKIGSSAYVLRPDGNTDHYWVASDRSIKTARVSGWVTCGMHVDPSDAPCIICP